MILCHERITFLKSRTNLFKIAVDLRMATVTSDLNFWNITGDSIFKQVWLSAGNSKTISIIIAISVIILSPIIVFGNLLVVFSIWKDPMKKLWKWPLNQIILSLAVADLMVGLVICILLLYFVILHRFFKYSKAAKTQDSTASCHQRMREREKHLSKAVAVVTSAFLTSLILVFLRQMQA